MAEHPPNAKHLPQNLKHAMQAANISAAQLARESGVSMASLSRILSGRVNPSFSNIARIANVLGVTLDQLNSNGQFLSATQNEQNTQELTAAAPAPGHEDMILVCYKVEGGKNDADNMSRLMENAARGSWVASWTDQFVDESSQPLPRVTSTQKTGDHLLVNMAYPQELFEAGTVTSLLSVIASVSTTTGARVLDFRLPTSLLRTFTGAEFGIRGLRDFTGKHGRPLLSATVRPMSGLSPRMYGKAVVETLRGGVDFTCDPTLLHSIPSNRWKERYRFTAEAAHVAMRDSNEFKTHIVNVSAPTVNQMLERCDYAKSLDLQMVMVDSAAIGWTALQSLAEWCQSNDMMLAAMGGRSLNGPVLSEQVQARLLRLVGCDLVSLGSPLRGHVGSRRFTKGLASLLRDEHPGANSEHSVLFDQPTAGLPGVFPAVGGGHNPWHFPRLIDALGNDTVVQCGGSVMGHPWGGQSGSIANRTAIEALVQAKAEGHNIAVEGRPILQRAMRNCPELRVALDYWQESSFLFGVVDGDRKGSIDAVVKGKGLKVVETESDDE